MQYWQEEMKWDREKRDFEGDFLRHRVVEEPREEVQGGWAAMRNRTTNYAHELADHVHMSTIKDPNLVEIDNGTFAGETCISIIAGNRTGSLLEMTQCIAEMGLGISRALVACDDEVDRGDWFYDTFWVFDPSEPSRLVLNEGKQDKLKEVMSLNPVEDPSKAEDRNWGHTILELSGQDRPGLLKYVAEELQLHNYSICSLAVWTQAKFAAFVLTVDDTNSIRITDNTTGRMEGVKERLRAIMAGSEPGAEATVDISPVKGLIHHDRRLHKLLFEMEARLLRPQWAQLRERQPVEPASEWESDVGLYRYNTPFPEDGLVNGEPWVGIQQWDWEEIWEIHILCLDRMKLAFDVAAALADLGLDVSAARIDKPQPLDPPHPGGKKREVVQHYYEVAPPRGNPRLEPDDWRAYRIYDMLMKALTRRHPPGAKVHLDVQEGITHVAHKLYQAGLTIKRARVNPFEQHSSGTGTHTFYLMYRDGRTPSTEELREVSTRYLGGTMKAGAHIPGSVDSASVHSGSGLNYNLRDIDSQWSGVAASPSPSSVPRSSLLRSS